MGQRQAESQSAALSKVGLLVPARGRRVANPPQVTNLPHKMQALRNPKTLKHPNSPLTPPHRCAYV